MHTAATPIESLTTPDTLQAGPDELRRNALVRLLVQCTKREAFHTLRTVEQLGYMVGPALSLLLLLWWRLEQLQAVCDALLAVPSMLTRRMLFPMRGKSWLFSSGIT